MAHWLFGEGRIENEMDTRRELTEIVRALRAHVEALEDSGVEGLLGRVPAALAPSTVRAQGTVAQGTVASTPRASTRVAVESPGVAASGVASVGQAPASDGPSPASARPPVRVLLSPEERRRQLTVLADEVATCTRCPLHAGRTRTVFARGNPDAALVFVSEGPGTEEELQGEPFVGAAGQLLDKMIVAMGYGRDDVYILNLVKCRPFESHEPTEDRKPNAAELAACRPFFDRQLKLLEPQAIVALGATAVQSLTGSAAAITRMRGTWRLFNGRVPLMPTFHPAYLLRSPEKKRDVWDDLKQVMQRLGPKDSPKNER